MSIIYSYLLNFLSYQLLKCFLTLISSPHTVFLLTSYSYSFLFFRLLISLPPPSPLDSLKNTMVSMYILHDNLSHPILPPNLSLLLINLVYIGFSFILIIKHNETLIHINRTSISLTMPCVLSSYYQWDVAGKQSTKGGHITCKYDLHV